MTDPDDDAPPAWLLATPTRSVDWWGNPALLMVVSVGLAVGSVVVHEPLVIRAVATLAAVGIIVGAVLFAWVGRTAYVEQSVEASWRRHVAALVVGSGSAVVVALLGLAADEPVLAFAACILLMSVNRSRRPGRPRVDVLVTMCAEGVIAVGSLVATMDGLLAHPSFGASGSAWFLPALLTVAFAYFLVVDRRALRTAPAR